MFGSAVLDVSIGLVLVFLMFSLGLTAVQEAIEGFRKTRARDLARALRELLDDRKGSGVLQIFYDHPLIYSLYRDSKGVGQTWGRHKGPSYIPARNFALAIIDLVENEKAMADNTAVKTVYNLAKKVGGDDLDRVRKELEAWYDSAMDRAAGWYRRRTQLSLLLLGLTVSVALNINTLIIARHLAVNEDLRKAVVASAATIPDDMKHVNQSGIDKSADAGSVLPVLDEHQVMELSKRLRDAGLPIGWSEKSLEAIAELNPSNASPGTWYMTPLYWMVIVLGYVITAVAGMLGAPFWFDVLNKIMVIRSTVKPHEKSPEEASEDRQLQLGGT
jgi:hypothetical protein